MNIPHILKDHCEPVSKHKPNTAGWIEDRRQGIGASDCPAILGLSQYSDQRKVWKSKKGQEEKSPDFLKPYADFGHLIEPYVINSFYESIDVDPVLNLPTLRSLHHPVLRASLDGYDRIANTVEEVKSDSWDDDDGLPDCHWAQCQHQMIVTGAEAVYVRHITSAIDRPLVPVLLDQFIDDQDGFLRWLVEESKVITHKVEPDLDWQQRWIERSERWWNQYVIEDTPPPESIDLDGTVDLSTAKDVIAALDAYAMADDEYKSVAKSISKKRDKAKKDARATIERYASAMADGPKRVKVGPHKATACKTKGGSYYWRIYPGEVEYNLDEF